MERVTQLFTFGCGQAFANCFVSITAPTGGECRDIMFQIFGKNWSMQYDADKRPELLGHNMWELAKITAENGEIYTNFQGAELPVRGYYQVKEN